MSKRRPIPTVISQHAEEAAFQWFIRNDAVHAPHFDLNDLADLDNLVAAHLDGLRIAGDDGWEICMAELAWQEPGEIFTAGVLACESGAADRIAAVTEAVVKTPEIAPGLASALGWLDYETAQPHIANLGLSSEPVLRRVAIAAAAVHRQNPGPALESALGEPDLIVTPRALRAAGETARRDLLPACQALVTSDDPATRFRAAWATVLLGDRNGAEALLDIVRAGGPHTAAAARLAARALPPERAVKWQRELAGDDDRLRLAIVVAGAVGDPVAVPWLISVMAEDAPARAAGEAFSFITGLDLAYRDLERDPPEDFAAGPSEDPADENVAMDPDEDLPWPDPQRCENWWREHGRNFTAGVRYLGGTPQTVKHLADVLRDGPQRQRAAAALELTLLQPGTPLFEVRARGDRQRRVLADGAGPRTDRRPR